MSEDRGVGSVIGAVIVLTILFTSVSSYLLFVERGDQKVNDSQKIRLEMLRERSIEKLEISLINDDGLKANITNYSPLTTTIVYYILISIEDNNVIKNESISITLKDGDNSVIDLEFVPNNSDYMIKLVTKRGSVFTDICYNGCYEISEANNNDSSDSITLGPMDVSLNLEYAAFTSSSSIEFNDPKGVAVDDGRIIVADTNNHRIQVFDSNGNFLFEFGDEGDGEGEFEQPHGIAVDSNDRIIVADTNNHRIQVFDSNGNFLFEFGDEGDGEGEFEQPHGIAVDDDRIIVADTNNHRIQVFDSNGNFLFEFGSLGSGEGEFDDPEGVAVDSNDRIIVADTNNHRIQVFDSNGNFLFEFGDEGDGEGEFNKIEALTTNGTTIFVADSHNHRIQVFDSNGNFLFEFGSLGSGEGEFDDPEGVAVDSNDRIIVADTKNDRIQVFDNNGNFLFNNFNAGSGSLMWLTADTVPANEDIVFRLKVTNIADNPIWLTSKTSLTLFEAEDSNRVAKWYLVKNVTNNSIDYLFDETSPYIQLSPNQQVTLYFAANKSDAIDNKDPPTMPTPPGRIWGVTLLFVGYFGESMPDLENPYAQSVPYTVIIAG
ncbi:MAG: hypothetical protein KatS3mg003_0364 [Candidatus Nitrosocaldaceae archaeon]|nr:MAG: hypothetical protein KatS3mg003_0364 [Candidatus Nitrosocaldaceae archaeon]